MDEKDKRSMEELLEKQTEQFQHFIGILAENFDHKLTVIAEGHQMLSEKMERVEACLGQKIDGIAAEVAAHRADTEAHHGVYRVKEED